MTPKEGRLRHTAGWDRMKLLMHALALREAVRVRGKLPLIPIYRGRLVGAVVCGFPLTRVLFAWGGDCV